MNEPPHSNEVVDVIFSPTGERDRYVLDFPYLTEDDLAHRRQPQISLLG